MDPIEKDISVTFSTDKVRSRKRKAETTVDNISDEHIDSLSHPDVEGKNAPQIFPTDKKAKKSLRKQTNTLPVLDLDIDVNNSSREQKHTSCSPKAVNNLQNSSINPTTVEKAKAKKPLKKQTKTTLPLSSEGDACDELKQKQNGQSPCSKAVNRGRQVDSTDGQKALTPRKRRAVGSPCASDQDMDVNNSSREQKHTSCSPKAANNLQNSSINPTTVEKAKAKKPLKKQTKTTLPLSNEGNARDELKQKQNGQSPCSKAVNRGRQVDLTDGQKALTPRKRRAVGSLCASDQAETTADNISDEHIDSLYHPNVEGKNAPQIFPTVKKAKKSLRKQTNTSPVLDLAFNEILTTKQGKDKVVKRPKVQKKDAEYPEESQQSNKGRGRDKTEEDVYVYRVLRFNEPYTDGLYPKDINSQVSLVEHVEYGSRETYKSKFISCCKTKNGVKRIEERAFESNINRIVVRINVTQLNTENIKVIDLTDWGARQRLLKGSPRACNYAEMFEEVILQPVDHIPAECVERIGIIKNKKFFEWFSYRLFNFLGEYREYN